METLENLNLDIIKKLCDIVPDPFVVFENSRNIVYFNQKAAAFFKIPDDSATLHELFNSASQQKLDKLIDESSRTKKIIHEIISLELSDSTAIKGDLTISEVVSDQYNRYFTLVFSNNYYWGADQTANRVTVRQEEVERIIGNPRILQIIDEIRSSYPFTFLGKNKIQQEINKLDEYFWIKDANDLIVLSNRKFASNYGLKVGQIEGKSEKHFLPAYYLDFYRSIESYIKETLNALIIEGVPFRGFSNWQNYETIEIPLSDAENHVLAIIGISQKKNKFAESGGLREKALFENVNLPVALFNFEENLLIASKQLRGLNADISWSDTNMLELFGEKHISRIHDFLENANINSFTIPEFAFQNAESSLFSCVLDKAIAKTGSQSFIIATFIPKISFANFEDLIKYKGKMFDLLVRFNPEPIFIYDTENLRFLEVNDAALALYGYRREEFLQLDLTDLYTPEDIQSLLDSAPARDSVPTFNGPFKHRKKDGSNIQVKIAKSSFDYEGHDAHFNIIHNVSDQAQSSMDTALFNSIFDITSDIAIRTDSVGFIVEANEVAQKFFGKGIDELAKSSVLEYIADENRGDLNTKVFFSGESTLVSFAASFKDASGEFHNCSVKALPVLSDDKAMETFLLIINPQTVPTEVIKEVPVEIVREVVKEVIREVPVERPAGLNNGAGQSTTGLDLSQISMMFHEILTPINVMLGFIQEIKDGLEKPTQDQKEAIDYINQNRDNLLSIMNAVSEYAQVRSKSAELNPSEIQFTEMFEAVLKDERDSFDQMKKQPAIGKVSSSLAFYSDEEKFKQFLGLFTRISLHISDENLIYVSASQLDDFSFAVVIRDDFSKVTEKLQHNFEQFLTGKSNQSPKVFSLSRYNFMALTSVLEILHGEYYVSHRSGKPYEFGFKFPINLFEERGESAADQGFVPEEAHSKQYMDTHATNYDDVQPHTAGIISTDSREEIAVKAPQPEPVSIEDKSFGSFSFDEEKFEPVTHSHPKTEEDDFVVPADTKFSFQTPHTPRDASRNKYEPISDSFTFESAVEPESASLMTREQVVERTASHAPVQAPPPPAPVQQAHTVEPVKAFELSAMKCLYIEDQVDSQILFKVQMKELQEIKFAVSFEEALPLLMAQTFDFIVMDINLQGEYNGLDALKMIHQMPGFHKLPIIAVTAYVLPGDKEKFIAAGFNDFISKPIFREKLIESLEKIFK